MNDLNSIHKRILEILQNSLEQQLLLYQRRLSKLSNLELIKISLTVKYFGIDSKNDLFRKLPQPIIANI